MEKYRVINLEVGSQSGEYALTERVFSRGMKRGIWCDGGLVSFGKTLETVCLDHIYGKRASKDKAALMEGWDKNPKEAIYLLLAKVLDPTWNIFSSAGHCTSVL